MAVTVEEKIKEFNKKFDKPKTPEKEKAQSKSKIGKGRKIIKNVGVGQNLERTLKNFRQEFNEQFDKPKKPEERKMTPMAKGGRAMYKSGSKGCKLAMKGKGRAYGKNS